MDGDEAAITLDDLIAATAGVFEADATDVSSCGRGVAQFIEVSCFVVCCVVQVGTFGNVVVVEAVVEIVVEVGKVVL